MRVIGGAVLLFIIGTIIYLAMLFRSTGQRHAVLGLSAIATKTILNPYYWIAFAVVLFCGWRLAAWMGR